HYVDSIRRYYDTLVWIDNQTKTMEIIEEKEQVEVIAEEVPAKSHVSAQ
ncbi:lytic transglycosylase F, partial [Shewanella sp. SR41-2]|nr:lytic transglycosylase F [Shewanella sp. SR41-2]